MAKTVFRYLVISRR